MRVIFHVGMHKTGTSLIQNYFRQSARRRVSSGIAVIPRHHTNQLIRLGDVVIDQPARLRTRIEAEARRTPNSLLISHESTLGLPFEPGRSGLYPSAPAVIDALAPIGDGFDTRIVVYVRPIASFVESFYLQTVQEGAHHPFESWFAAIDAESLSWSPLVSALDDSFGRSAVEVGDFREIEQGQSLFLQGFMKRSALDPWGAPRYRHRSNPSLSAAGLDLALERNRELRTLEERRASRTYMQIRHSNVDGLRARPMPAEVRDRLEALTEREYELLASRASAGRRRAEAKR